LSQGAMLSVDSVDAIGSVLRASGWGWTTGLSAMLFSLLHYPCGTTVYTVYRETGSAKWAWLSFLVPTIVACVFLIALNGAFLVVGLR